MTFRNRSGNGVTLNRIATRGNEDFLTISRRFIFPSQRDATGHLGHSAEQKAVAALRVLVYAEALDQRDHLRQMSEESIRQCFLRPPEHITEVYAQTVKLPTNDAENVSASDLRDQVWNLLNQNSVKRKKCTSSYHMSTLANRKQ
jgi:hypothetical protein